MYKFKFIFVFLFTTILIGCERDIAVPELYQDLTTYSPALIVQGTGYYTAKKDFDFDIDGTVDLSITNQGYVTASSHAERLFSLIEAPNSTLEIACILTDDTIRYCLDTAPVGFTYDVLTQFNTYPPYVSSGSYAYDTVHSTHQNYYPMPLSTNTISDSLNYIYQSSYIIHTSNFSPGISFTGTQRYDIHTNYGLFRTLSDIKYIDFRINKADGYHYGYIKLSTSGYGYHPDEYISVYEIYYRH